MSVTAELVVVFVLILLNGFFAMSELAIVSSRRTRLRQLAEDGDRGAALALTMADDPASFLSIVQIGMTLNSVITGAFSGTTLAVPFGKYLDTIGWIAPRGEIAGLILTVAGVTYLNLVLGELLPKRIGLAFPEPIAIRVAFAMRLFAWVAAPIVWLLRQSTELSLRLLRLASPRDMAVTEEEVKDMIHEGAESGVLKPAEKQMLEGVMRLSDRTVRAIMTPRIDMVWLDARDDGAAHINEIRTSRYSRFPIARGDLEEILGIIHAKDIVNASFDGQSLNGQALNLARIMRPALVVPDTTTVLKLLEQFKRSGQHIAVVADEYGSVEGLVSATDILQAITGELPERGRKPDAAPVQRDDGSWVVDGMTPIDEIEHLIDVKNMRGEGDFHTLAGFIVERLGRLPGRGDVITWDEARFEVLTMAGRRVDKVLITPVAEARAPAEAG